MEFYAEEQRFCGLFGCTPYLCEIIWNKLSVQGFHPANSKPLYLPAVWSNFSEVLWY
jgi:hypothetical protein